MATPAESVRSRCAVFPIAAVVGACLFLASGCSPYRVYRVKDLPAELLTPPTENVEAFDVIGVTPDSVTGELIDRGDVLDVTIITNFGNLATTTTPVRVGEDGNADVPLIGEVALAGLELEGAEKAISAAAVQRGIFRDPHVTVTMRRQRVNRITVIGGVAEPGLYELPRGTSTLFAALVTAGGLSDEAGPDVEIRRPARHDGRPDLFAPDPPRLASAGGNALTAYGKASGAAPQMIRVNLVEAAKQGRGGYYLDDGDVVMVAKRNPRRIHVIGLVNKPGQYELPPNQDVYLLDALAMAGERASQMADKVLVIRRVPGQPEPARIRVSLREAKNDGQANLRLAAGDVVSVEQTPATFLWDAVGRFLRVGVSGSLPLF